MLKCVTVLGFKLNLNLRPKVTFLGHENSTDIKKPQNPYLTG